MAPPDIPDPNVELPGSHGLLASLEVELKVNAGKLTMERCGGSYLKHSRLTYGPLQPPPPPPSILIFLTSPPPLHSLEVQLKVNAGKLAMERCGGSYLKHSRLSSTIAKEREQLRLEQHCRQEMRREFELKLVSGV
jgi:hypothetical protein